MRSCTCAPFFLLDKELYLFWDAGKNEENKRAGLFFFAFHCLWHTKRGSHFTWTLSCTVTNALTPPDWPPVTIQKGSASTPGGMGHT